MALAKRMKMGRMSSLHYSCSYAKKSTSTPEGEDRRASTKNLLARPASTGDMAWDEFSSASSPVESRLCKIQLIGPHRWGERRCAGGGANGIVSHWEAMPRVCSKKGRTGRSWVCDWAHAYSDRMSVLQGSGSLMRGVSSLVSPQPL